MAEGFQRFTAEKPCPVCGGSENDPRGQGTRCFGFVTEEWIHCTREDHSSRGADRWEPWGTAVVVSRGQWEVFGPSLTLSGVESASVVSALDD